MACKVSKNDIYYDHQARSLRDIKSTEDKKMEKYTVSDELNKR